MDTRMLSMGMDVAPESSDAEALTVRYGAIEPLPESWEGEAMAALDGIMADAEAPQGWSEVGS